MEVQELGEMEEEMEEMEEEEEEEMEEEEMEEREREARHDLDAPIVPWERGFFFLCQFATDQAVLLEYSAVVAAPYIVIYGRWMTPPFFFAFLQHTKTKQSSFFLSREEVSPFFLPVSHFSVLVERFAVL